jgi:hypothetical protein
MWQARRAVMLTAMAAVMTIGLAGCGGSDGRTAARSSPSNTTDTAQHIVFKTRVHLSTTTGTFASTGVILAGSAGNTAFCMGGTIVDKHGTSAAIGLVDRTITCQDGTLRIGFDPQMPVGNTQRGPWRIVSGTRAYEGWHGGGGMVVTYDDANNPHPSRAHETYRGTVTTG